MGKIAIASSEIKISGGYDEEEYEPDYEESFKTNLPYGYEVVDGRIVVDNNIKEVVAWIFDAMVRYSKEVPDILVKQLQQKVYEELGVQLEYGEAIGRISKSSIEEYLCTELNVRLMSFNPDDKENNIEQIKECLSATLNEEQILLIEDRFLRAGSEYRKEIIRHMVMDSNRTSMAERRQAGQLHGKVKNDLEKTTSLQRPPKR